MVHSPAEHATLSPSASERWISCPASIRMERAVELPPSQPDNIYSAEGTAAHVLAHITARYKLLGELTKRQFNAAVKRWVAQYENVVSDQDEMNDVVARYLAYLDARRTALGATLLLEQRLPTGVPSCWGTTDAALVSPTQIEIVDLKYGKGVWVDVNGNPQLRLYAVGALEAFGDLLGEVELVRMTVYQPRVNNVASEELTALELRGWRDSIIPIANQALGHDAPFGPSDAACRWCPAAGQCKAQLEWATTLDFGVPVERLDGHDLAEILPQLDAIESWCAAVRSYALDLVYNQGGTVPGYKAVLTAGKRRIEDEEGALAALTVTGYALEEISNTKIKGIGDLEKLLGKPKFQQLVAPYVAKSTGNPTLAPESDNRPATDPNTTAAQEFKE